MVRLLTSVAVSLMICTAAATSSDPTWRSQFRSKINVLPTVTGGCSVCFYEQANYTGSKFCIGKRVKNCNKANPIQAPGTIESIKFSKNKNCQLVVNARVTDPPYAEHVDVISTDVANTGYNLTMYQHSIQEIYVEEAGRACFLGTPSSADGFGLCYHEDVPAVEDQYRDVFTELLIFKTKTNDFDVIAYENDNYNGASKSPVQRSIMDEDSSGLSYRFTGYSKNLEADKIGGTSGMKQTMQGKVRSIAFVAPEDDATPGTVAPYSG
ncbi:peroxisomal assembly protein [Phytophthora boehmeriae]|uniref:Peroxisomal assembly protein n=1 Tax=Phytophthora boehmeriae TaxID=109152 RepID=A0A8T1WZT8_9STRA|nr:peroxisomal assembly protein [Phytophthora boehmeriae]